MVTGLITILRQDTFDPYPSQPCCRRTELFPYETCIFFTVVTALITLPRQELKAKVVDAPEILTIISTIPHLEAFLNSFYSCKYAEFLQVGILHIDSVFRV